MLHCKKKLLTGNKKGDQRTSQGLIGGVCQRSGFPHLAIPWSGEAQGRERSAEPIATSRDHDLRVGGAGCELDGRWAMHPSYEHYSVCVCQPFAGEGEEKEVPPRFRILAARRHHRPVFLQPAGEV